MMFSRFFFFFKQKTAYEMRISDWSSDVCSSDLYMIRFGGLDMVNDPVIGLVVETACRFHQSIGFPETIEACLRTAKLGNSSVRHEIGLFRDGQPHPAATEIGRAHV